MARVVDLQAQDMPITWAPELSDGSGVVSGSRVRLFKPVNSILVAVASSLEIYLRYWERICPYIDLVLCYWSVRQSGCLRHPHGARATQPPSTFGPAAGGRPLRYFSGN